MASVMASVVLVPVMGALFARPRRTAGFWSALGGLAGLVAFYSLLFNLGVYDPDEQAYVWRVAGLELWPDYAVLCALPASLAGFILGHLFGSDER
jgi:hypothetical protein